MASTPILDSGGNPMAAPPTRTRINDGVIEAMQAASGATRFGPMATTLYRWFGPSLAYAAYRQSGMLQKVIDLHASDRVRGWRAWQAEADEIERLEAEEARLELKRKVKAAELLRGLGGGALILVTEGNHAEELKPEAIREGGLVAVNVVSRDQLTLVDIDEELASPTYGQPRAFRINTAKGGQADIHPSRVVCFRGSPLIAGNEVSQEEAFWGQSLLMRVYREVEKSDCAQAWFAELVKKAKLLRIGIPNLTDFSDPSSQGRLNRRMAAIATGESILNAVVYDSGDGKDGSPGEKIDDYQVSWTGIPAMMDAFDQRVAAVASIPFTVLMGRSPAGMNSTGDHDRQNWYREVAAGQELELRACLDQIDAALVPSALGKVPPEIWWKFSPLDTPSEAEEATRFKTTVEAMEKVQLMGVFSERAFAKGGQNTIIEGGWMPGVEAAAAEDPEDIRFGLSPEPGDYDDPSALQATRGGDPDLAGGGGRRMEAAPSRRAANDARFLADAEPKTLYVQRKVLNAAEIIRWAKGQGLETTPPADDMHVTIAFSRQPVDWFAVGSDWSGDENGRLRIKPGGPRTVERLGDGDAVALLFQSDDLRWRHERIREAGASWDWPDYRPHITLTWQAEGVDVDALEPYTGPIVLGPELFSTVDENWKAGVSEK